MEIRGIKNFKNKDYKIYRIHALSSKQQKNWEAYGAESQTNWSLINDFKIKFINKFSEENYDELIKYTYFSKYLPPFTERIEYKKNWLFSQIEIGMDMIEEKYNIVAGNWIGSGWTLAIPFKHSEIIDFVDNNLDSKFYEIKKRLY